MDKTQFYEHMSFVKGLMQERTRLEERMHNFDFFSYYDQFMPLIFFEIPREELMSPSFKQKIWEDFKLALSFQEANTPKVEGNVIDFNDAKARMRA
jgi:hypothetical protein